VEELAAALDRLPNPLIITMPNADAANRLVSGRLRELAAQRGRTVIADNLGARAYFSLMACVGAMVGNSSSGIIEAPSLGLPVVNIGTRQQGRTRAGNVIDVGYGRDEIAAGLDRALSAEFRRGLEGMKNPYGDGRAAPRIVRFLAQAELGPGLLMKRFHDLPGSASSQAGPS
jgi:UDP-N-acetylglucosamine 2-epimerase